MLPHEIPAGADVTVPEPAPARVTVSVKWGAGVARLKVAVHVVVFALRTTVTVGEVPAQAPDHPPKLDPVAGVAVRPILEFLA